MTPTWDVSPHPDAYDNETPGNWRQHNIQIFPGGMRPPDFTEVGALMVDWVDSVNAIPQDTAPVAEAVARRHANFERIHPFIDGNGRSGRLLTNLLLVRLGYPPAIIYQRDRSRYLEALRSADQNDFGPLGELFARAILDNLMRFIVPAVAGPARLVPLESLVTDDLGLKALQEAARRGRLRALKSRAGTWQSSRQWVDAYRSSRHESLRQPRPERRHQRTPASEPITPA